jgi:hypothetical protein
MSEDDDQTGPYMGWPTLSDLCDALDEAMKKWDDIPADLPSPADLDRQARERRPMPIDPSSS